MNNNVNRQSVPPSGNYRRPANGRNRRKRFPWAELFIGLLAITAVFVIIWAFALGDGKTVSGGSETTGKETLNYLEFNGTAAEDDQQPSSSEKEDTFDPDAYTEIKLLNMGDIMYHQPQLDNAVDWNTGEYDFSGSYKYLKDIVSAADYAVVNFEATLSCEDYTYAGYPTFNAPDSAFTTLVDAGFDMMLFANNHCYDYGNHGFIRTQEVFKENGVDYIGAKLNENDKSYKTVDINGVKVGMINSTDDLSYGNTANRTINGIAIRGNDLQLMDVFNLSLLDDFYKQTEARIKELREGGADIIVYYIHWGLEYHLAHNDTQAQIASKLCDMGVDVIIGGHPHVVQDAEVLTSTVDPEHKTLCFYSLGNVISNQNRLTMGNTMNKEYTENGLIVELTIRKYDSGECMVTAVETIPTWVHRYSSGGKMQYEVLPVEVALAAPEAYGLYNSNFGVTNATASLTMTNDLLGDVVDAFAATVTLPTGKTEK
ncbi:MAG: CapA family protein [Clostridia bacterium]|nr:CapA family protein [Clostridia bacterium]